MHRHRAVQSRTVDRAWGGCVVPESDRPCDGRAHGGIVRREACRCGAQRQVEITHAARRAGPWGQPA